MSPLLSFAARRAGSLGAFAAVFLYVGVASSQAQESASSTPAELGRVEFTHTGTSNKFVEINLSPDMFGALFGIGDGALAGIVDGLNDSPQAKEGSQAIQLAAEKAAAARELVGIVKDVVKSVRVRAYDGLENAEQEQVKISEYYDKQLQTGGWENAVRAQDGDKSVQIAVVRGDGAIRGLFVIASESNKLVLVNVLCDVSPENAKKLTTAAVKSGLEAGLGQHIEEAMKHAH
jgi:hypothetical protein